MAKLTGEAYVDAIQSEEVTFLIGLERIPLSIPKGLLMRRSESLTELAEANDGEHASGVQAWRSECSRRPRLDSTAE